MDKLLQFDTCLFYYVNIYGQNSFFDVLMPFITDLKNWYIPIAGLWIFLLIVGGKKGRTIAFLIIPLIFISDQLSSSVLKPLIGRIRPCNALEDIHLLVNKSYSFSFPSSHASNIFAAAFLFSYYYRRFALFIFLFAVSVGYSRIYVGVHYPLDVFGGALLGILCSISILVFWRSMKTIYMSVHRKKCEENRQ